MGWFISIGLFIGAIIFKNPYALVASALFAIAGSISINLNRISSLIEKNIDKNNSQ